MGSKKKAKVKKKSKRESGGRGFLDETQYENKTPLLKRAGINTTGVVLDFRPYSKDKQLGKKTKK